MTSPTSRAAHPLPAAPAVGRRILAQLFPLLRRLVRARRAPRLRLDELSRHRRRDLGLSDGR